MTGRSARQIVSLFGAMRGEGADTWNPIGIDGPDREAVRLALQALTILADERDASETTVVPVITSPRGARARRVNVAVDELLQAARDEIIIIGYELSEPQTLARLAERASLGVRVDLLVDAAQTSAAAIRAAWPRGAGDARLWMSSTDARGRTIRLHAKVLIVDGRRALVGSANFTRSGMRSNVELGVLLAGPAVSALRAYAEDLIRRQLVQRQADLVGGSVGTATLETD